MNITKSYLRQLIKEELTKLEEAVDINQWNTEKNLKRFKITDPKKANPAGQALDDVNDMIKKGIKPDDIQKYLSNKIDKNQKDIISQSTEVTDKDAVDLVKKLTLK